MNRAQGFLKVTLALVLGAIPRVGYAAEMDAAQSQKVSVHGDIASHCSISSPGDVDFGDLNQVPMRADLRLGLNCNIPFSLSVRADHGALTNAEFPGGQGPYSGSLPYELGFTIPTRMPSARTVTETVSGGDLIGGKSISSRGGIATEGMGVTVTLGHANGNAGLIAGDYAETITITVASI